jgi:hypothetical protein
MDMINPNQKLKLPRINMKTVCFLFTVVGFGALTLGITFADPPSGQSSSQLPGEGANQSHTSGDHPAHPVQGSQTNNNNDQTDKKHSQSNADSNTPEKVSQAGSTKTQPKRPSVKNTSQPTPGLNKTPAVVRGELPVNKLVTNSAQPPRPPAVGVTAVLGPGIVRKSAGPTTSLGGLAASSIKTSTAGINGTGMQRKIYR